jgi:hypothetical protein
MLLTAQAAQPAPNGWEARSPQWLARPKPALIKVLRNQRLGGLGGLGGLEIGTLRGISPAPGGGEILRSTP